jgi:hypothetical protein
VPDSIIEDPLGREIRLTNATWFGHILKGHPDMARQRLRVEHTVRKPLEIQVSTYDVNGRIYYSVPNKSGEMIVVVADIVIGIVKTAYVALKKKKGSIEWKAP